MANPSFQIGNDFYSSTTTITWFNIPTESNLKPDSLNMRGRIASKELFHKLFKQKYGK